MNIDMGKVKVMVVEDELIVAINVSRQLMMMPLDIDVLKPVSRGEKAIEVARRERPDFILMDILLATEMNGVEAARVILSIYNPIIVFASGFIDEKISEEINSLNAYKLRKPYEIEDVKKLISDNFQVN